MASTAPVLLIIDMQKGMLAEPPRPIRNPPRNNPEAEANIAKLLTAWRTAKATVVHVRHISREAGSLRVPVRMRTPARRWTVSSRQDQRWPTRG